ncbi:MAG: hypothetical protein ABIT96_07795 [Ferruginibacter sp.]
MTPPITTRKIYRLRRPVTWLLVITAAIVLILSGLNIWLINNARMQMESRVFEQSKGKITLVLPKLNYNFLNDNLQIKDARIYSNNPNDPLAYNVSFSRLDLRVQSLWALVFKKQLLIDSIRLQDPVVSLVKNPHDDTRSIASDSTSLPQEMGIMYNSMIQVLDRFNVRRILINNASFTLTNPLLRTAPVHIDKVFLNVARNVSGSFYADQKEAVDLSTTNQFINLPGGRHVLAFKRFRLQLLNRKITLDSCTIIALPTDSTSSSYKIYFDRLNLVGVDFAAMYLNNIIKADSVYCINPLFQVRLNTDVARKEKKAPDFDKVIRDLTGDLNLGYVGVKDAGIQLDIVGKKPRSLLNSHKDNFYIKGLVVNAGTKRPVDIDEFNMLVRDYRLYNEDSSAVYGFESLHFKNKKIQLHNFTVKSDKMSASDSRKDFNIPEFQLTGLDWYELVFNQNLSAEEALLINPVIKYTKNVVSPRKKHRRGLFGVLATLDSLVTLQRLQIVNGQVDLKLASTQLHLENANLGLNSNMLLRSSSKVGLISAVKNFSFKGGNFISRNMDVRLDDVYYTEDKGIHARYFKLNRGKQVQATLQDVEIGDMYFDEKGSLSAIENLTWQQGNIVINKENKSRKDKEGFTLVKINGNNTDISFNQNKMKLFTHVNNIHFESLQTGSNLEITSLFLDGSRLQLQNGPLSLTAADYQVIDGNNISASGISLKQYKAKDSMRLKLDNIHFLSPVNDILRGQIALQDVQVMNPSVYLVKNQKPEGTGNKNQDFSFENLKIINPDIYVRLVKNDSSTSFYLPAHSGNAISAGSLKSSEKGIEARDFILKADQLRYTGSKGNSFSVKQEGLNVNLGSFSLNPVAGEAPFWQVDVNSLRINNPDTLNIADSSWLYLLQASLNNFHLSRDKQPMNIIKIIKANSSASFNIKAGQHKTSTADFSWDRIGYNAKTNFLEVDSFLFKPTLTREQTLEREKYQGDFITAGSREANISGMDLDAFSNDSTIRAENLKLIQPSISIYRDKSKPMGDEPIKPLLAGMIMSVPYKMDVNNIRLDSGLVMYTEKNGKSGEEGVIKISDLRGTLSNIKNTYIKEGDSLLLDVQGKFLEAADIYLKVKESYKDTLGGMRLSGSIYNLTREILNPILLPLANVRLKSGNIDSVHFKATANDYLAYGEMQMYYRDLKIQLVKKGDSTKSGILLDAASFLVNTLLLKRNSNGRTGTIFFERLRDKSFFNYLVKIATSGMPTAAGIFSNKKYEKKYALALKKLDMQPLAWP